MPSACAWPVCRILIFNFLSFIPVQIGPINRWLLSLYTQVGMSLKSHRSNQYRFAPGICHCYLCEQRRCISRYGSERYMRDRSHLSGRTISVLSLDFAMHNVIECTCVTFTPGRRLYKNIIMLNVRDLDSTQ